MYINKAKSIFICKIVYYGPAMSGKVENLQFLKDNVSSHTLSDLTHDDSSSERVTTLTMQPVDIPKIDNLYCQIELKTITGNSYSNAMKKEILKDADAIIFVADSRTESISENIQAMNEMLKFMNNNEVYHDVITALQYNKSNEPSAISPTQLNPLLNASNWEYFTASSSTGEGVIDTCKSVMETLYEKVINENLLSHAKEVSEDVQGKSWILTCTSCQSLLEVPEAKIGDVYTCGSCNTVIAVVEPETGKTSVYQPKPLPPKIDVPDMDDMLPQAVESDDEGGLELLVDLQPNASTVEDTMLSNSNHALSEEVEGFSIINQLGFNLLGTRYLLQDKNTNQQVRALSINPELLQDSSYLNSVKTYAQKASQIKHDHLVVINALRINKNIPVIISQNYKEYDSLSDILSRRRIIGAPQAIGIIRKLAMALEEASRHGVVHGWINPDIVLISASGDVVLDDLGLYKDYSFLLRESMGGSAATEYYLAPELISTNSRVDNRTDIFLLGALLFRMITGEGLVTGYNAHEALHSITSGRKKNLRDIAHDVSRDLDSLCARMTASLPQDRFQSYADVIDSLKSFGGGAKRNTMNAVRRPLTAQLPTDKGKAERSLNQRRSNHHARRRTTNQTIDLMNDINEEDFLPQKKKKKGNKGFFIVFGVLLLGAVLAVGFILSYSFNKNQEINEKNSKISKERKVVRYTADGKEITKEEMDKTEAVKTSVFSALDQDIDAFEKNPYDDVLRAKILEAIASLNQKDKYKDGSMNRKDRLNSIVENRKPQASTEGKAITPVEGKTVASTEGKTVAPVESKTVSQNVEDDTSIKKTVMLMIEAEKFGEAEKKAKTILNIDLKDMVVQVVNQKFLSKRQDVESVLLRINKLQRCEKLIDENIQRWQHPEDTKWKIEQMLLAKIRIEAKDSGKVINNKPAVDNNVVEPPTEDPIDAPQEEEVKLVTVEYIEGIPIDLINKNEEINKLLQAHKFLVAKQSLDDFAKEKPDIKPLPSFAAMTFKIELFKESFDIMPPLVAKRKPRFLTKTPFGKDKWQVVSMNKTGFVLGSAGSELPLTWGQIESGEIGGLYKMLAEYKDATAKEKAMACVALLVSNKLGPAAIIGAKATSAKYKKASNIKPLLRLARAFPLISMLDEITNAVKEEDNDKLVVLLKKLKKDRVKFKKKDELIISLEKRIEE